MSTVETNKEFFYAQKRVRPKWPWETTNTYVEKNRIVSFEPPSSSNQTFSRHIYFCRFPLFFCLSVYSCVMCFFVHIFPCCCCHPLFSAINMILLSFSLWLLFCFTFLSLSFSLFISLRLLYYSNCVCSRLSQTKKRWNEEQERHPEND